MTVEDTTTWVPDQCTLPTTAQPLRIAEFDDFFGTHVQNVRRVHETRADLTFDASALELARDLTTRESACCSFFTFAFTPVGDSVTLTVEVPRQHVAVLDALCSRALANRESR